MISILGISLLLPPNKREIGCKWVFKLKFLPNDTVERYKVRLVAKDFNQTNGLDYQETFSHVIKITTIRVLLSIYSSLNWHVHQLYINTTFLHGDLKEKEEVYMKCHMALICLKIWYAEKQRNNLLYLVPLPKQSIGH